MRGNNRYIIPSDLVDESEQDEFDQHSNSSYDDRVKAQLASSSISETLKNLVWHALAITACLYAFVFSGGSGFFHYAGLFACSIICLVCILQLAFSAFSAFSAAIGITTFILYFDDQTDKQEKLLIDVSNILQLMVYLLLSLSSYQFLSEYGDIGLPNFEPFGIRVLNYF